MTTAATPAKSRLWIVFETFLLLGFITAGAFRSVIPLLAAGILFGVAVLNWRTPAQREKFPSAWIVSLLGLSVAATAVAIYFGG